MAPKWDTDPENNQPSAREMMNCEYQFIYTALDNEFAIATADETIFCNEQKGWYADANQCVKPITNIRIARYQRQAYTYAG
eukprot:scaffold8563_cov58-Attheya_sp.AAC.3